jgi:hypothetical protein
MCVFLSIMRPLMPFLVYIFGGRGEDGECFNDTFYLNTSDWRWVRVSPTTSPPPPRLGAASLLVGNKIVIHGGWNGKKYFDDMWVFDTEAATWIQPRVGGKCPCARHDHSLTLCSDGRIVLFAGFVNMLLSLADMMIWCWCFAVLLPLPKGFSSWMTFTSWMLRAWSGRELVVFFCRLFKCMLVLLLWCMHTQYLPGQVPFRRLVIRTPLSWSMTH